MNDELFDFVGIGSPLVDVLAQVHDSVLEDVGLIRGSMALVELDEAEAIYKAMGPAIEASGGSAANSAAGVAALGGSAAFIGKVGEDALAKVFTHDLEGAGVRFHAAVAPNDSADTTHGTGRCLVMVTQDAERTMATHLGAATTIAPKDIPEDLIARARIVYLEGYLWDMAPAKAAMRHAISVAHNNDCAVALSLSDSFCVDRHRSEFLELVTNEIDILFGNEEEVCRLFGSADLNKSLDYAQETGILVAVTRGHLGSVVIAGDDPEPVPAAAVTSVIDTTGAGDLYAAGFCYGLTHGLSPIECARLGSLCASEVISHIGARPQADLFELATKAGLL